MTTCEECEDDVRRRVRCFHCGLLVCPYCWHHIHGCGPSHTRSECRHYAAYLKRKGAWINIVRAATLRERDGLSTQTANAA
jgi:hypothetical protein